MLKTISIVLIALVASAFTLTAAAQDKAVPGNTAPVATVDVNSAL